MPAKQTKQEQEYEARLQIFASEGLQKPPSTDLSHLEGKAPGAPAKAKLKPVKVQAERPAPPAPPSAPAVAPPVAPSPWDGADPKLTLPFQLRLPQELHMQVAWLVEQLPGRMSMQKLMLAAIEQQVQTLLAKHYVPLANKEIAKT